VFWSGGLTHRDERNPLVSLITSNSGAARVKGRFAIDQEAVSVMAMRKLHLRKPTTVRLPAHRIRERIPPVEIPDKTNEVRGRSRTIEVHRLGHMFGAATVIGRLAKGSVHSEA
jgi:hypothetical protein